MYRHRTQFHVSIYNTNSTSNKLIHCPPIRMWDRPSQKHSNHLYTTLWMFRKEKKNGKWKKNVQPCGWVNVWMHQWHSHSDRNISNNSQFHHFSIFILVLVAHSCRCIIYTQHASSIYGPFNGLLLLKCRGGKHWFRNCLCWRFIAVLCSSSN